MDKENGLLADVDAMIPSNHRRPGVLEREALDWLLRLTSGEATADQLRQFSAWRSQSKVHAEAYRSALGIWRSLDVAGREIASPADRAVLAERTRPAALAASRRMFLAGGLAAAAAAAGIVVVRPPLGLWSSMSDLLADYHTAAGEQRTVTVTEKVSAELNTRTSIDRRIVPQGEAIELIKGEVAISSACSADDPFVVLAAGGRTRSARAKFNVRYEGGLVRVTCLEGTVQIEQGAASMVLQSDQQASYSDRDISSASSIDPTIVTAWQRGLLIFRDEQLSQVVEEVNRYWSGRIVVLDRDLGSRRVTLRIELARIGEIISYVETVLGAKARSLPGGVVLLS
jgi:transmembrane sensor